MDYGFIVRILAKETIDEFVSISRYQLVVDKFKEGHALRLQNIPADERYFAMTVEDAYDRTFDNMLGNADKILRLNKSIRRLVAIASPDFVENYDEQGLVNCDKCREALRRVDESERERGIVLVCDCGHECFPCECGFLNPTYAQLYDRAGNEIIDVITDIAATARRVVDANWESMGSAELFTLFDMSVAAIFLLLAKFYASRSELRAIWRMNEADFNTFMYLSDSDREKVVESTKAIIDSQLATKPPEQARVYFLRQARRFYNRYRDGVEEFERHGGRVLNGAPYDNIEWRMYLEAVRSLDLQKKGNENEH